MSHKPSIAKSDDVDSLSSWISDHLGEGSSYMTDEVNQSPTSPMEGSPIPEVDPLVTIHPSVEEKNNIMTLEELGSLRESYSFPPGVQIRLPKEGETIVSACPGEVTFYEASFLVGFYFPIHPTISAPGFKVILPSVRLSWVYGVWDCGLQALSSCSNSTSESNSDSGLHPKFKLDVKKSKNRGSTRAPIPAKGVVIGEKQPRDDDPSSPSKKGKVVDSSKGKEAAPIPEPKKKTTRTGDSEGHFFETWGGKLTIFGHRPRPMASILDSPSVAEKILWGRVGVAIGRGPSSGATCRRQAHWMKVDHDSLNDKLEQSGVLVVELKETVDKARSSAVEEFKSSSDFWGKVKNAASKYFGERFDFCKWKLRRHHPNLAINLENMGLDLDLLAEEDEAAEGGSDGEKYKGDDNPPPS
ncbi:hypothetical protein Acr_17g0008810 [Actinidia rufa]|uniref:Uncharacterized protein n=1 Tax=Actinidia rufa TaxID=165716 RepID=A0A7J0G3G2_9ERIC|nr:hypothetical protein Acr_17g0008810 [Actinidia rufa]